ncbi:MAG TPA: ABC transporter substrate-binding protein [Dehalococcoidia bacterium]|nr:ABC transporter substrate-binding protein [Dehalococcoidia bacterium]
MTSSLKLKAALGNSKIIAPLKDGSVTVPGIEFEQIDIDYQVDIWRQMSRTVEYDVSLMSVVSYLCAIEYDVPFTCLPVCLNGGFHHSEFIYNVDSGIKTPKDLEGKRVGTRTWTVTPGTLDRGILVDEFGVDWRSIEWVLAEPEHVPQAQEHLPPNVSAGQGEDLFPRLVSGDIHAGIAGSNLKGGQSDKVKPLFPNAIELDKAYYQKTGIIQPFVILAIKNSVLQDNPWVSEALYEALKQSKQKSGAEATADVKAVIGKEDPFPFGLAANRDGFNEAIRLSREFEVIKKPMTADDIFPHFD